MSLYLQTKVEESSSKEMYEDIHSLIKEITRESSSSVEVGLSFKFSPTEASSAGAGSDAGSAGEGGDVANTGEAGEAASPSEDGPGVGGDAEGPGDGGEAESPGGGQNAGPGSSAGIDTKQEKISIIKQLSEITTTKVSEIQVYSFYCFLEQLFLTHLNFIYCNSHLQAHKSPCSWNRLKFKTEQKQTKKNIQNK